MGESRGQSLRVWGLKAAGAHVCVYMYVCVCVCVCVYMYVCVCVCLRTERAGWENNGEPLGTERLAPLPTSLPPYSQTHLLLQRDRDEKIHLRHPKAGGGGVVRRRLGWEEKGE